LKAKIIDFVFVFKVGKVNLNNKMTVAFTIGKIIVELSTNVFLAGESTFSQFPFLMKITIVDKVVKFGIGLFHLDLLKFKVNKCPL
jgi:hypothetical protein